LLVEDETPTREALTKLLTKGGAQVTAVATSEKALAAYKYSPPDVIISDIGLPEEDGHQFLQKIRAIEREQKKPAVPAIALTAYAAAQDRRLARDAGFQQHLAKPVDPAVLIEAIAALAGKREDRSSKD
jgi:CheY-like chemotaxis protein